MLQVNPWVSMWRSPRETIRSIVEHNPRLGFGVLSFLYGLLLILYVIPNAFLVTPLFFLGALIAAPFLGVITFLVMSGLLFVVGKWLGGKSSFLALRAAVSWSHVPSVFLLLVLTIFLIVFRKMVFCVDCADIVVTRFDLIVLLSFSLIQSILGFWVVVLLILSIAEVQEFSIGRAFCNFLIAIVGVFVVLQMILLLTNFNVF